MKKINLLALFILSAANLSIAKINIAVSVVRNGNLSLGQAMLLDKDDSALRVFQDASTYIEAELVSEKDDLPVIQFIVATKNESNMYIVRGMPKLSASLANGLGMASMQCDGRGESFILIMAISKP